MNTAVTFEIAKLLKEKRFTSVFTAFSNKYYNNLGDYRVVSYNVKIENDEYEAPTIAEVVMWLYEKHGIWIEVIKSNYNRFEYKIINGTESLMYVKTPYKSLLSPTEAYKAAILYCLNNLI